MDSSPPTRQITPDTPRVPAWYATVTKAEAPITEPVTKLGGAPVFLEPAEWPICRNCSRPMEFLGQLRLDDPAPLSDTYAMAYIFMCSRFEGDKDYYCETWDPSSGANSVLVQRDTGTRVEVPDQPPPAHLDWAVALEERADPDIDTEDLDDIDLAVSMEQFKLGGVPKWIQGPEMPECPACGGAMCYIAQMDESHGDGGTGNREDSIEFNFGEAGEAYIFLCEQACGPNGAAMLWQCG